jgi:hypothetical protein
MKSRNRTLIGEADSDEYMQACSACTHYSFAKKAETKLVFEPRQLYATEAEDYFFYFIPAEERSTLSIAV